MKISKATPTASQAWWLERSLAAHPCGMVVLRTFSGHRMRSLESCVRRGWLNIKRDGNWIRVWCERTLDLGDGNIVGDISAARMAIERYRDAQKAGRP